MTEKFLFKMILLILMTSGFESIHAVDDMSDLDLEEVEKLKDEQSYFDYFYTHTHDGFKLLKLIDSKDSKKLFLCSKNNENYALKKIQGIFNNEEISYDRVHTEYLMMKKLMEHPSFLNMYSIIINIPFDHCYIQMELFEGKKLSHYLKDFNEFLRGIFRNSPDRNPQIEAKIMELNGKVGTALQYMHQNDITHGGLNEENIFVIEKDGSIEIRILDFSLSIDHTDARSIGSVPYDIWSTWCENSGVRMWVHMSRKYKQFRNQYGVHSSCLFELPWDSELKRAAIHDDFNQYLDTLLQATQEALWENDIEHEINPADIFEKRNTYSFLTTAFIGLGFGALIPHRYDISYSFKVK